jgi:hypothetical protein
MQQVQQMSGRVKHIEKWASAIGSKFSEVKSQNGNTSHPLAHLSVRRTRRNQGQAASR